jgi:hypothetical protein
LGRFIAEKNDYSAVIDQKDLPGDMSSQLRTAVSHWVSELGAKRFRRNLKPWFDTNVVI